MKKAIIVLGLFTAALTSAHAGALFDDYLNYVRPGTGTGPGNAQIVISQDKSAGQTFTVPDGTGEIYRIGIRPVYETWNEGEKVIMALYDSPEKKTKLGEYTIDHATCRVDDYVVGNGSEFQHAKDFVLYFQFRKPVEKRTQFYFELMVSGGDGRVSVRGLDTDTYQDGQAYKAGAVKDVAFECHIKPAADKEANLRQFFTERLDTSRPEFTAVKAAVDARDWEKAIAETVKHFHNKMDIWNVWKDVMDVKVDPNADTKDADLLLKNMVVNGDTGQPMPWRPESYWAPLYPGKQPNHVMKPSPYLWHIDRELAGTYTATGKSEYARKSIDLRMQWILDNPNPKVVYGAKEPFPWYFELWNDRTAGGRTPGHGDLVYARLYKFSGWTNDERLIFMSFIEDNARWVYKATSGANWGAEAARASLEFGIRFPEWKMSKNYREWGASRLAQISMEDIRKDGTSHEAAIKYHAMVARRLKGMIEDYKAGNVPLEPETYKELEKVLAGMYEHMAYSLQPNSFVVMGGDSWYENYTNELAEVGRLINRPDFLWVASQGKEGQPPKEISRVYPEGGYFIMRSDFGGNGLNYADSRQLFVHNGGWSGSHGHWDLLSINLYGYGRPLVIDPGQYSYTPPQGIDNYWESRIHSMLVLEGGSVKREPGPTEWVSNSIVDWLDGRHYGYANRDKVNSIRRRIAFIKPYYFLVDDSADTTRDADWAQVWNTIDPNAKIDPVSKTIETTFSEGGNIIIMNQDPENITVEEAPGITASSDNYPKTKIFRLHQKTDNPRFASLLYPYKAGARPKVEWTRIKPDDASLSNLFYSVRVNTADGMDWAVFGESGKPVAYRNGSHKADADFAVVRMDKSANVKSFTWTSGKQITFSGKTLAQSANRMLSLAVSYNGPTLTVDVKESESTLAVRVGNAKNIVLNGKPVSKPVIKNGMYYPFAGMPVIIVADDRDAFEKLTQTIEWTRVADTNSWATGYTHHETDPGRSENGNYVFNVPSAGRYSVEVSVPDITMVPSDRVDYRIPASGTPVAVAGAVVNVKQDGDAYVITVNHQTKAGWVKLGDFDLPASELKINAKNMTEIDGIYFTADAVRLVKK